MVWFKKRREYKAKRLAFMTELKAKLKAVDDHCKVVFIYGGVSQDVPAMYDRPRRLCNWWKKEHCRDSQYASGVLKVVSMYNQPKTS